MPQNSFLTKRIIVLYNGVINELNGIYGPILSPFYCDVDKIRFMLTAGKRLYWIWDDGTKILLTLDNYMWDASQGLPPLPPEPNEVSDTFAKHIKEEMDSAKGIHGEIRYWEDKFQYYDDNLQQWLDVMTEQKPYSNVEATELGVGGILPGTHLSGKTLDEILNKMFFNTAAPSIVIQASPSPGLFEIGDTISSVSLDVLITKGQNPITSVKIYKDATLIYTGVVTDTPTLHYIYTHATPFNANCIFKVVVEDSDSVFTEEISFKFVSPIYVGKLNKTALINQINIISNLTEMLIDQNSPISLNSIFTTDDERIVIAYPSGLGDIVSIMDMNDINLASGGFIKSIVPILLGNGSTINYNVYSSENSCTVSSYKLTFNFNN